MKRFDVSWWGKPATFLLMFAVPGLHARLRATSRATPGSRSPRGSSSIPGLAISYWTAITYIPTIRTSIGGPRARPLGRSAGEDLPA